MKKNKIIKNTIYSILLQFVTLAFSLFLSPYVSRALGAEVLGTVNFSTAFVGWFSIFALFGSAIYGVRAVVKAKDDPEELSKVFSEIFVIKTIASIIALVPYIICIFTVAKLSNEKLLYIIQGAILLLNIFSFDWLFQGLEDYKYIAIRSILFKMIAFVCVIVFVQNPSDYVLYALFTLASLSLSNILNIFYIRKKIKFTFKGLLIKRHLKPLSYFLLSSFLINIYMMIDQTMLGFLKGDYEVSLVARSRLFLNVGLVLTTSVSNAIMPRLCALQMSDKIGYNKLLSYTKNIVLMLSVPIAIGIFALAPNIMYLFGGEQFMGGVLPLKIFACSIPIVALGGWNYSQRVVAAQKEQKGIFILLLTAIINIVSNIILIPLYGAIGAAISYVIAEAISNIIWFIYMRKVDKFSLISLSMLRYVLVGLVMGGILFLLLFLNNQYSWLMLVLYVLICILVYFLLLLVSKDPIIWDMLRCKDRFLSVKKRKSFNEKSVTQAANQTEENKDSNVDNNDTEKKE